MMGNHDVGRAMAAGAKAFWAGARERAVAWDEALSVLDILAEPFLGADAEFDDEMSTETGLSLLVAIAFKATPDELADLKREFPCSDGYAGQLWFIGPERRFRDRYNFC